MKPSFSITGIAFIGDVSSPSASVIAISTAQKELRFYDYKANSVKPIFTRVVSEHPIIGLYYSSRMRFHILSQIYRMLIFTDTRGGINLFDERTRRPFGKLRDHVGAVQDIFCSEKYPILVSIGLDRFLRIYEINDKRLLLSVAQLLS